MSTEDTSKTEAYDVDTDRVDDETAESDKPEGADQLGDAGKKALDSMKTNWKTERDKRKALEKELAELKSKSTEKPDETPDADTIRAQAKAEAQAEAIRERALDKIEAKAAKLFADPEDARALLAGNVDDFVDNGKVDVEAITEALDELLAKKPHLAATPPRRFEGGADGGARKSGGEKLTRSDVEQLAREGKHAEIAKANREGRIDFTK
ncbi:hypothetical protein [Micromonospora sp. NPDC047730]|uniref:hypothetical protein n=1 Tax=Micromonospora sp. NPDC047730 TaxID=3364253 RepID=UPI00371E1E96